MEQTIHILCVQHGTKTTEDKEVMVPVQATCCKGLALHKAIGGRGYTLTHMHSSYLIATIKTNKKKALVWLRESAEVVDFTAEDILKSKNVPLIAQIVMRGHQL